jgi:hypothetical protein
MSDQLGSSIGSEHTHNPGRDQEFWVQPQNKIPTWRRDSRARALAEQLLRDRAERAARKAARIAAAPAKTERVEFDPFAVTRWRVVAGGDPGYLVRTPMRRGPVGWFVACRACAREFESKGWAYCPDCMALPAEERRDQPKKAGPQCQGPGCGKRLSIHARADARLLRSLP